MTARLGALIAVDGVDGTSLKAAARAIVPTIPRPRRGGVSQWDASGLFSDLMVAPREAGTPSARTLLLFYAADVAFRLRWQIRPAIDEGRIVIAAPWIATAVAFGRAAGLPAVWLHDLFEFALRPAETRFAAEPHTDAREGRAGFVHFSIRCLDEHPGGQARRDLVAGTRSYLKAGKSRIEK